GSPTSRPASPRLPSPNTRQDTAISAPPAPRSSNGSPAATASAALSPSPPAAPGSSPASRLARTSPSPGPPSPTQPTRPASPAATAASTSSRVTSTPVQPDEKQRRDAGRRRRATSTAPRLRDPPRSEQLTDERRRSCRAVAFDRNVSDLPSELLDDRFGNR